ncbi:MAG: immunity 40 family protein [Bacteroides sp.]|nr:immunity 40 family protein [Bacteroides sp.]
MKQISIYLNFIREHGRSLSEINPGSTEIALTVEDALQAVDLLNGTHSPVLGGDILSEDKNGELIYAYQLWDEGYHYLNWYCNKEKDESQEDYIIRSYREAKEGIKKANDIAMHLSKKCYIVLVV